MHTTLWVRAATIAAAGLGALAVSATAWASTNAVLRSGQAPTTAAAFPYHSCDGNFGGGPYPDRDVWVFVLPSHSRDFITLTASFDTTGDRIEDTTVSTATAGGIKDDNGSSKAWIPAPAGATLLGATAVATGQETDGPYSFNISRTCPAVVASSPSPAGSGGSDPSASPPPGTVPGTLPGTAPAGVPGAISSRDPWRSGQVPSPVGETAVSPEAIAAEDEDGVEPSNAEAVGEQRSGGQSGTRHGTSVALSTSALLAVLASVGVLLMVVWRRRGRKRPEAIGRHRLLPDPADLAD